MFGEEVKVQPLLGSKDMDICDRATGENGRPHSPGPLSWYLARRARPELKYALTANGYVVLP